MAGGAGHDSNDCSLDEVFDLLVDERRRVALACLTDHSEEIALADLAEGVAIRENGGPITEISKETVRTVYMSLYHTHVPKLSDAGVVEYDQDRDLVRISESVDVIERVLAVVIDGDEDR